MGSSCCKTVEDPIVGFHVAHEGDIYHNGMKEVDIGPDGHKIVIAKYKRKFFAFGNTCPHHGAPMAKGAFRHGMVRCPWHGACFNAKTGDIEDYPGLECLPTYKVNRHKLGGLYVVLRLSELQKKSYLRPLCKRASDDVTKEATVSKKKKKNAKIETIATLPSTQNIVIVGSGAAGFTCAVTLRQHKFQGRILMITSDWFYPYDRTLISKNLDFHWVDIKLRNEEFYMEYDIEVLKNTTVEKVDFEGCKLKISTANAIIGYHQLLIATGIKPRIFQLPGSDLENIFTVQSLKDTQRIYTKSLGKKVVIVGSYFIAMEMASSLDELASSVVVLLKSKWPYGVVFGRSVGTTLLMHFLRKTKNVKFKMVDEIKSFNGNSRNEVISVTTRKKQTYACDVVVLAEGGVAATEFLEKSKLALIESNKTIPVGRFMRTVIENVYAAGDVTTFPSAVSVTGHASIAQWGLACKQGKVAALNMLGMKTPIITAVPFHWTTVWGETIRCCGNAQNSNEVLIFGDPKEMEFCALYRRDGIILAAVTCNADPIASELAFDLEHHIPYKRTEYPAYVTDRFPKPPYVGDRYLWVKFDKQEEVRATDARNLVSQPRDMTKLAMTVTQALDEDKEKPKLNVVKPKKLLLNDVLIKLKK